MTAFAKKLLPAAVLFGGKIRVDASVKNPGPKNQALGYPWKGIFYC
jgi:hypothetical protein